MVTGSGFGDPGTMGVDNVRHAVFPEAALVALKAGYVDVADVLV